MSNTVFASLKDYKAGTGILLNEGNRQRRYTGKAEGDLGVWWDSVVMCVSCKGHDTSLSQPSASIRSPASSHLFHYPTHPMWPRARMAFINSLSTTPEFPSALSTGEERGADGGSVKGQCFHEARLKPFLWGTFSHTHNSGFVLKCYSQIGLNKETRFICIIRV